MCTNDLCAAQADPSPFPTRAGFSPSPGSPAPSWRYSDDGVHPGTPHHNAAGGPIDMNVLGYIGIIVFACVIVLGLIAGGVIVARKRAAAASGGGLNAASRGGFSRLGSDGGGPAPRSRRAPSGPSGPSVMDRLRALMPQRKDRQYRSVVMEYAMQPMTESSSGDGYAPPELDGGLNI